MLPSLAADAAVGAVADAGSRTGRVGDLGRGLLFGEECVGRIGCEATGVRAFEAVRVVEVPLGREDALALAPVAECGAEAREARTALS